MACKQSKSRGDAASWGARVFSLHRQRRHACCTPPLLLLVPPPHLPCTMQAASIAVPLVGGALIGIGMRNDVKTWYPTIKKPSWCGPVACAPS